MDKTVKNRLLGVLLALTFTLCALVPAAAAEAPEDEIVPECMIFVTSNLTRYNYGDLETRTELAVGDTVEFLYSDAEPADVVINGETVFRFPAGERQFRDYVIAATGPLEIAVRRGEAVLLERSFTVIDSASMYRRSVQEALTAYRELDVSTLKEDLIDGANNGFPVGNPFWVPAATVLLLVNYLTVLFSFTRIIR